MRSIFVSSEKYQLTPLSWFIIALVIIFTSGIVRFVTGDLWLSICLLFLAFFALYCAWFQLTRRRSLGFRVVTAGGIPITLMAISTHPALQFLIIRTFFSEIEKNSLIGGLLNVLKNLPPQISNQLFIVGILLIIMGIILHYLERVHDAKETKDRRKHEIEMRKLILKNNPDGVGVEETKN